MPHSGAEYGNQNGVLVNSLQHACRSIPSPAGGSMGVPEGLSHSTTSQLLAACTNRQSADLQRPHFEQALYLVKS